MLIMSLTTDPASSVSEALASRVTVRQFQDREVDPTLLRSLVARALRAPSSGNLQPWKLHVMTGRTLADFKAAATERTLSSGMEEPTHPAYPPKLWAPYRDRRFKVGEDMYALLGIPREDKAKRLMWLAQNSKFFEAPVGIIVTGDKRLAMPQYMDVGIMLQTLMLLAREQGLHTAPQGWWRHFPSVSHDILDIPEEEEVLVGMSMGYAAPNADVNRLRSDRATVDELVTFYD